MNSTKTEISLWVFILLIIIVGTLIGLIINTFNYTSKSNHYKDNSETDDYDHLDFD